MADFLLQLAANKRARKVVTTLGLPLPMPERLERGAGAWEERPLFDRAVVVGSTPGAELGAVLAETLGRAGADPWVLADDAALAPWRAAGEAWGRPPQAIRAPADDEAEVPGPRKPWALVFDATGLTGPADLRALYDFFHPRVRDIGRSGRLLVIGRSPEGQGDAAAAASRALEGFVKSAGREIGRKGATANLVWVDAGADDRLEPALRFLLSPRSAYVSGQPIRITKRCRKPAAAPDVRPLEGKVALVTGAARGIGESIAETLAREGAKVIVLDRPDDDALASEVARRIGGVYLPCDVTAADAGERITAFVSERFGKVDVVIHNAGVTRDKTLANMRGELWDLTIDVNLASVIRLTEALEPLLGKDARIVCLSSIAGIAGNVGQTNYSASKAGVIGFVQSAGPRLAKKGVALNAIAPGFIETRLTDAIPVATREVARRLCNLGQGGLPIDIAEVATFLSSPGAAGVSGQILRVCGGSYVGA